MANELLEITEISGLNIYFVVTRTSDNYVLDFSDQTFKAVGSATTPYIAATPTTVGAGYGNARYQATLNLAYVSNTLAAVDVIVTPYIRAGGSPALSTDAALIAISLEQIRFALKKPALTCKLATALRRNENEWTASVTLEADGSPLTLATGSCSLTIRGVDTTIADEDANWWPDLAGSLTAAGRFEFSLATPGFNEDRAYNVRWTITQGGTTKTFEEPAVVLG